MKCCKCEVDKRSNEMALDLKLSCKHSHFSLCYKVKKFQFNQLITIFIHFYCRIYFSV